VIKDTADMNRAVFWILGSVGTRLLRMLMRVGAGAGLAVIAALTYSSASMIVLQEPDALNKVQFPDCHYQIYGIEVVLTAKASGQICFRVHSRVGLFA